MELVLKREREMWKREFQSPIKWLNVCRMVVLLPPCERRTHWMLKYLPSFFLMIIIMPTVPMQSVPVVLLVVIVGVVVGVAPLLIINN